MQSDLQTSSAVAHLRSSLQGEWGFLLFVGMAIKALFLEQLFHFNIRQQI